MTATLPKAGLFRAHHFGYAPTGADGNSPHYPTVHAIYFKDTTINLRWHHPNPGYVTTFGVEVSLTPDFSDPVFIYEATMQADTQVTFTDAGENDRRRYWRWRWSADSGTTWSRWSRVGSYWLNTDGAENISISRNSIMMINPDPVTDRFPFEIFPLYSIQQSHIYRLKDRNRLGTLVSEYETLKGKVGLSFDNQRWMNEVEFSEARRFNEEVKTFFLAMFHDFKFGEPVPNIWKVQYDTDPLLTMIGAGRQDMLVGSLSFSEV